MFLRFVNNFLQRSVYANSHQIWLHWVKPPTESDENLLLKSPNCHLCMLGDFDAFKALWPIFLFYSLTLWVDRYLGSSNPLTRYVTTLCFPPEVWNSDNKRHRFFLYFINGFTYAVDTLYHHYLFPKCESSPINQLWAQQSPTNEAR